MKEIKRGIDRMAITQKDLPAYGITCAKFCMRFYDPHTEQKEYREIYQHLWNRFVEVEKLSNITKH